MRRPSRWLLILVVGFAACSGGGSTSGAPTTTTTRAVASPGSKQAGCRFIVAATGRRFRKAPADLQYLQGAVAEPTECYDKITFTFDKGDGPDTPPGYTVEYREPPFIEGIRSSAEGFPDAKAILYVEFRPVSTSDRRFAGRAVLTYKGNLRLGLTGMAHTVIVEWLDKAPPALPEALVPTVTTTTPPTKTSTSKTSTSKTSTSKTSTSTSTTAPADAATPTAPTTTLATVEFLPNDPTVTRVVWLIGLDSKRRFTVDASNQPSKISVLIMR